VLACRTKQQNRIHVAQVDDRWEDCTLLRHVEEERRVGLLHTMSHVEDHRQRMDKAIVSMSIPFEKQHVRARLTTDSIALRIG
jgi:hypothetical protein